jgi:hypothetical protein
MRPGWRQARAHVSRVLPVTTGYHLLEGVAEFVAVGPKLILTVVPRKPVPGNLGPSVQRRRSIHWAHGPEKPEIERVLSFEVESVARLMAEKQWPPRELYLDRCNLSGVDLPVFLETTCARCVFPYCELRG